MLELIDLEDSTNNIPRHCISKTERPLFSAIIFEKRMHKSALVEKNFEQITIFYSILD